MTSLDEGWWLQVLCGSGGDLRATTSDENYVVLPRVSDPRVLVDAKSQPAMRDALKRFVENRAGAAAGPLAEGATKLVSRKRADWNLVSDSQTLRSYLSEIMGTDLRLSIAVGPPRPNRKPIVRCYDGPNLVAVAKLGPDPHTAAMVANEGDWLEILEKEPLDVATPTVLHRGTYGPNELLVLEPFVVDGPSSIHVADVPLQLTRDLRERFDDGGLLIDGGWWTELQGRLAAPELSQFSQIAAELARDETFRSLESSMWHGDWSPWNMGKLRNGRLIVWDWERATIGTPVGFDLLHLHYQYGDGFDAAQLPMAELGVSSMQKRLTTIAYFLELAARHYEGGALGSARQRDVETQLRALWPDGSEGESK